jgi:lipoprotein signal peptidase
MAFFGGMFNIFDRVIGFTLACNPGLGHISNQVLDYFRFSFKWGIFNFPDIFILTGIIGACVLYIIFSIIDLVLARKADKHAKK